jgi:HD-GYP domain-containing protein (c-di-GMP phosphodiesterase class II)
MKDLLDIAGAHHERYDGSGYPNGDSGDRIPVGARIIAVADAYDAMTSQRPYQQLKSFHDAKKELIKYSGSQFDPEIVRTAVKVLQ